MAEWTEYDDKFLKENFENRNISVKYIAKHLRKSDLEVRNRAKKFKLKRLGSMDINNYIIKNIETKSLEDIAIETNRALCTIRKKAIELNLIDKYEFRFITTKDIEQVIKRYSKENTFKLSADLSLPVHSVRKIARENNILKEKKNKKKIEKPKKWNKNDEKFISENYYNMTAKEIASALGKDYNCTRRKIRHMGYTNNLKTYVAGNIVFHYNTSYEKEYKLKYINDLRTLFFKDKSLNSYI